MKIYSISLYGRVEGKYASVAAAKDLTAFSYFQRGSIAEFMDFFGKTLVERTTPGTRQTVEEKEYFCHVYVRADGTAGVVITDQEYPNRVAMTLINKLLDDFKGKYPQATWTGNPRDTPFPELELQLKKYQDPTEADAMMKIQKDLDETKEILHRNLDAVLQRGEKIEDLVAKSDDLSASSKMFYKQAKKTNSCCVVS